MIFFTYWTMSCKLGFGADSCPARSPLTLSYQPSPALPRSGILQDQSTRAGLNTKCLSAHAPLAPCLMASCASFSSLAFSGRPHGNAGSPGHHRQALSLAVLPQLTRPGRSSRWSLSGILKSQCFPGLALDPLSTHSVPTSLIAVV